MVERMAPNHDIRVRFLEPLFAEISADFFHIFLSRCFKRRTCTRGGTGIRIGLKIRRLFVMRVRVSPGAFCAGNRMLIFFVLRGHLLILWFFFCFLYNTNLSGAIG